MENQIITYTVVLSGKPQGPYKFEELKELNILPGTFIKKPGMDDYKEAHEFPELRALFGFVYEKTAPQYFAAFDQRLLAAVIDYFILLMGYIFILLISFAFLEDKGQRILISLTFLPLLPVAKLVYGCITEASAQQAGIGKKLLGIKVTDLRGNRISLVNSLGRNVAKILSVLPLFFGYLYSFLNKKQQCWHDIAANTLVIKDRLI